MTARLLLSELGTEHGELERTYLTQRDATLLLEVLRVRDTRASEPPGASGDAAQTVYALPPSAVDAVMRRYGRPIAEEIPEPEPALRLDAGAHLSTFRHLARFDVIARDYVYYRPDASSPGLAALSVTVAAALRFLAERAQ